MNEPKDRPYVICHMQSSIDGRISGKFFFTPAAEAVYESDNDIRKGYRADAIMNGGKLVADGREGIFGLTLSNAMHLSSWTGKAVDLPLDEALFKAELDKRIATSRRKENVVEVVADTSSSYNSGKVK